MDFFYLTIVDIIIDASAVDHHIAIHCQADPSDTGDLGSHGRSGFSKCGRFGE